MKLSRIALFAALATGISAPALAYTPQHTIVSADGERGYVTRWDSSVQGKSREQVKAELARARLQDPTGVRIGVFRTPRSDVVADANSVRRDARNAARLPVDPQYHPH